MIRGDPQSTVVVKSTHNLAVTIPFAHLFLNLHFNYTIICSALYDDLINPH